MQLPQCLHEESKGPGLRISCTVKTDQTRWMPRLCFAIKVHHTGRGSLVGSMHALQAAVKTMTLASGTFFHGKNFPLLLIKEEQVVTY